MSNLCIIPARGGSKRIPRKNIKNFLGKPIIAYSIEAAINSNLFDEVMVSTDEEEIAKVAVSFGAKIPFYRSAKTSNDYATTFDVIEEVIQEYKQFSKEFDFACCIYACAPFVNVHKLKQSFDLLKNKNFDSVFPVLPFGFPIQRAMKIRDEKVSFLYPEFISTRSQDLERSYHDAGQFYWLKIIECLKEGNLVTQNSGSIIVSELEAQDIDNETDWELAKIKFKNFYNENL